MRHPIPDAALDDRLGFVGTSGSGKTYSAGSAVERLLHKRARVVIVDPLGVWWGLRLLADGNTPSPFNVAIFGGPRGDLPLNQHAGELIGETAATMAESCIVDLTQLGTKSAERRFMTGFLDAIYRKAVGEPFHLVVDEADLFAPQKPPKGDETLLNLMEQIVRRGRVKGFLPWLITQRPAVINKNVLSQVDGLAAFKLTASQDRDALDAWIEGQADKAQGKAIKDALPALPVGTGVVWVPGRGILETKAFPLKETFDSSRTPKRGEKLKKTAALEPLDLGALKGRLASVEAETKANDPKALRAEIAKLRSELQKAPKNITQNITADPKAIEAAEERGFERAKKQLTAAAERHVREAHLNILQVLGERLAPATALLTEEIRKIKGTKPTPGVTYSPGLAERVPRAAPSVPPRSPSRAKPSAPIADGDFNRPQLRVLQSLAMWAALGHDAPTREMVAAVAGYSPSSGGYNNLLGSLGAIGAVDKPRPGHLSLAVEGIGVMSKDEGRELLLSTLTNPQKKIVAALIDQDARSRDEVGDATGYSPSSGGYNNLLGSLSTLGIIVKPQAGYVALSDWAQELLAGCAERVAA